MPMLDLIWLCSLYLTQVMERVAHASLLQKGLVQGLACAGAALCSCQRSSCLRGFPESWIQVWAMLRSLEMLWIGWNTSKNSNNTHILIILV